MSFLPASAHRALRGLPPRRRVSVARARWLAALDRGMSLRREAAAVPASGSLLAARRDAVASARIWRGCWDIWPFTTS